MGGPPTTVLKRENLAKVVNNSSRKVTIRGKQAIVPLLFGYDGNPASADNLILKRLSLDDLRFLKVWRESLWDVDVARNKTGISESVCKNLIKKLSCFREEDARVKALCEIPTPSWIKSKHVENFYEGGTLEDSQHKSLQELAKIEGAYKNTAAVSITQNVFNLPKLTPEVEAEFRLLAEKAIDTEAEQAA